MMTTSGARTAGDLDVLVWRWRRREEFHLHLAFELVDLHGEISQGHPQHGTSGDEIGLP